MKILDSVKKIEVSVDKTAKAPSKMMVSDIPLFKSFGITSKTNPISVCDFCVIDIETTGIGFSNKIIEISAVRFVNFFPTEYMSTLVNPGKSIPKEATAINGITDDMVKNSPFFHQVLGSFKNFIGDSIIVAHNGKFDCGFCYKYGLDLMNNKWYDTFEIAKKKLKSYNKYFEEKAEEKNQEYDYDVYDYKLKTLCRYYGVLSDKYHNSVSDCIYTGFLFANLCNEYFNVDYEPLLIELKKDIYQSTPKSGNQIINTPQTGKPKRKFAFISIILFIISFISLIFGIALFSSSIGGAIFFIIETIICAFIGIKLLGFKK